MGGYQVRENEDRTWISYGRLPAAVPFELALSGSGLFSIPERVANAAQRIVLVLVESLNALLRRGHVER